MKFIQTLWIAILFILIKSAFGTPVFLARAPTRITTAPSDEGHPTQEAQDPQDSQATTFTIKFVPLITLITELLKTLLGKLGEFNGVNKPSIKRNATQENEPDKSTENEFFDSDTEKEQELIECNAASLGLWPDKTNSQRYYKCELDPRTPALANCVKDYFRGRSENKTDFLSEQGLVIPVVKPCFLLSMMKCANGFRYSHKSRICIPDVVFGSL